MGGGRYGEGLDDTGELAELLGDAFTLPDQQRHLGTGVLDDTPCLRAELVCFVPGLRDDGGTFGARPSELFVGGALATEHLLRRLLAEGPRALLGLGQPVARPLAGLRGVRLGVLADAGGVALAGRPRLVGGSPSLVDRRGRSFVQLGDMAASGRDLVVEALPHATRHLAEVQPCAAYDVRGLAVADIADA